MRRVVPIAIAALAAGGAVVALMLTSDHLTRRRCGRSFAPAVGWSFIGTGLYARRQRPESRTGALMVAARVRLVRRSRSRRPNAPLVYTIALVLGGLWGSVFLHLGISFPTGRLTRAIARW